MEGTYPAAENMTVALGEVKVAKIAIVGAGIAGIALAVGLAKSLDRYDVHVFERSAGFSDIGAGLGIAPNSFEALETLSQDLAEAFTQTADFGFATYDEKYRFTFPEYRDAYTGEFLDAAYTPNQASMHRSAFVKLLVQHLDPKVQIHFQCKVRDVRCNSASSTLIYTQEGADLESTFELVIGADGMRSTLRAVLFPDPHNHLHFSGTKCYRGVANIEKVRIASGEHVATVPQAFLAKNIHIMSYPIAKGTMLNAIVYATEPEDAARGRLPPDSDWVESIDDEVLMKRLDGMCKNVQTLGKSLCPPKRWALHQVKPLPTWHAGRVLLIGDASHGMLPHVGAGAAIGLEDAAVLAGLLNDRRAHLSTNQKVEDLLNNFECSRKPRGEEVVDLAEKMGRIYQLTSGLPGTIGDHVATVTPPMWHKVWDYSVKKEIQETKHRLWS